MSATPQPVQTQYGAVSGIEKDGCTHFLGIPYAKPPIGELAFLHPQEPEPWEGLLKADHASPNPIQHDGTFALDNNSQDCLYLNVFVPQGETEKMPVLVWIYGGSYAQGGAGALSDGSLGYDMCRIARETGCIVVSFNYRLNLYGFLNLHALDERFDRNNGLFDQLMALRFVHSNIAAFGGDPDNVTLFGQSAGGACILALMSMPEADGLYHKTVVQSACFEHFFTEEEGATLVRLYLKKAGVKTAAELRELPEEAVKRANKKFTTAVLAKGDIRCAFSPIIDGVTLKEAPVTAAQRKDVPLLIGNTSEEGALFLKAIPGVALPVVSRLTHIRPLKGGGSYRERLTAALTRHIYVRPQEEIVAGYQGPVWRYVYRHTTPGDPVKGSYHTSELPAEFALGKTMTGVPDPDLERVGQIIWAALRGFAHHGNPGWEAFAANGHIQTIE